MLKGTLVISIGTVLSQLIQISILPILTRLYSPEEFGLYGAYLSVFSILASISSLRYEQAIAVTRTDLAALNLVLISVTLAFITSLGCFLAGWSLIKFFGVHVELELLLVLCIAVIGAGIYRSLEYWAVRKKLYVDIAISKNIRVLSLGVSQVFLGLVYGHWVGNLLGFGRFLYLYIIDLRSVQVIRFPRFIWGLYRYKKFPRYDLGAIVLNILSAQVAILFFIYFYSASLSGQYLLVVSLLSAPIALIGKSVSQVLLSESKSRNYADLREIYLKSLRELMKFAVTPFTILLFLPESFFIFLFGDKWVGVGSIFFWTALWVVFQFIYSPLSVLFSVVENTKEHMKIQIVFLGLVLASIVGSYVLDGSSHTAIVSFSIANIFGYVFAIIRLLSFVKIGFKEVIWSMGAEFSVMFVALLLGFYSLVYAHAFLIFAFSLWIIRYFNFYHKSSFRLNK